MKKKRGAEEAQALVNAAVEFALLRTQDPVAEHAASAEMDLLVRSLQGVCDAIDSLPVEVQVSQREFEWPLRPLHVGMGRTRGPTLASLAETAREWLCTLEPRKSWPNGEAIARVMAYDDRTALAGWMLLRRVDPSATSAEGRRGWWTRPPSPAEMVAIEVIVQLDAPSELPQIRGPRWGRGNYAEWAAEKQALRNPFEVEKRRDRWRKVIARARKIIAATTRMRRARRFVALSGARD